MAPSLPAPMISVAGIRGIVGESLRLEEFVEYALGFLAGLPRPSLVLGSDTRASGDMLRHAIHAAAISSGVVVHDLGVAPTPTVGFMVRKLAAGGGIVLTASHNPPQWNALKFFSEEGSFLSPDQLAGVLRRTTAREFRRAGIRELGRGATVADPVGPHLETLLARLPVEAIRAAGIHAVLDACNGAGLEISTRLFDALGVRHEVLHAARDGEFERPPEPTPEHLGALSAAVRAAGADVGFALDPDADRLAVVDETGRPIGEERTVTLAIEQVLRAAGPAAAGTPVVVNLSTTRAVDDVAARHGARVERTAIGEAHVVGRMKALGAAIGGEGNGGVILPAVHPGRDSATGMGLLLALLSGDGAAKTRVSELDASIPSYAMVKDKLDLPDRAAAEPTLAAMRAGAPALAASLGLAPPVFDETDGVKLVFADRWLHVRASGTEPILRLFSEAPSEAEARALVEWARRAS